MAESLEREIRDLRTLLFSERDPEGRGFAPLADALRRAGDLAQALELVEEGVSRLPEYATGHVVSGWVHRARGEDAEAEGSFRRVLELDDENVSALRGLGLLLAEKGEADEALEVFRRLDELDPGDPEVRARLVELGRDVREDDAEDGVGRLEVDVGDGPVVPIGSLAPAAGPLPVVNVALLAPDEADAPSVPGAVAPAPTDLPEAEGAAVAVGSSVHEEVPDEVGDPSEAGAAAAAQEPAVAEMPLVDVADLAPDEEDAPDPGTPTETADTAETAAPGVLEVESEEASATEGAEEEHEPDADEEGVVALRERGGLLSSTPRRGDDEDGGPWTRTMAELYARQGLPERAARIYRRLLEESPDDQGLRARLAVLEAGGSGLAAAPPPPPAPLAEEGEDLELEDLARHMASGPDVGDASEGPFAWGGEPEDEEDEAESGAASSDATRTSDYFRGLLDWQPSGGGSASEAPEAGSDPAGERDTPPSETP